MIISSPGVCAYLPSLHQPNWKRSLRMTRKQTKVQGRFRSKWRMERRSSIQIIQVDYWILFSIQSTTSLNMSVLMGRSYCWMPIQFAYRRLTVSPATRIQFRACLEPNLWPIRSGQYGSLWGDGFGIVKCPGAQVADEMDIGKTFSSMAVAMVCKLLTKKVLWGGCSQLHGGIRLKSGWIWRGMTIPGLLIMNGSGIHCRDLIQRHAAS